MNYNQDIWYHGSPRLFSEFGLGYEPSSRLGDAKSIYLTKSFELAMAFSRNKTGKGYVYTVEVNKNHTGRLHKMKTLTDHFANDGNKDKELDCIEIYDVKDLKIISTSELEGVTLFEL
jgi:hypothetical protein